MSRRCVVHYNSIKNNEPITQLKESTLKTLHDNAAARQRLGGKNGHAPQCASVPKTLDIKIHGYHQKCYKKFTKGVAIENKEKAKVGKKSTVSRPTRTGIGANQIFPKICMFCKSGGKKRVYTGKQTYRREEIHKIQVESAEHLILKAADGKQDQEMRGFVAEGKLREREFQYHLSCYTRYVKKFRDPPEQNKSTEHDNLFPRVIEFVQSILIDGGRSCSMNVLVELYGKDINDKRWRNVLKEKLQKHFPDELIFLNITYHSPQLVMHKACVQNNTLSSFMDHNKESAVRETAKFIRKDILHMVETAPKTSWPPRVKDLMDERRQPPELVKTFLKHVLHDSHHPESQMVQDLVWSFSQDLVHGVSRGKFLTAKHTLMANVMHGLTGQKVPILLMSKVGNCQSYNLVELVETAQAELVEELREAGFPLPVLPLTPEDSVTTGTWYDNFDVKKEDKNGGLHTTHGVCFQEEVVGQTKRREDTGINLEPSGNRTVNIEEKERPTRKVVKHFNPTICESNPVAASSSLPSTENSSKCILTWKLSRTVHARDEQIIPKFVGWVTKLHQKKSNKTVITYLPPIRHPINEYSTVVECILQAQNLAKSSNMKYTHITADAGAAAKFYHVIWNNKEEFKDVLIHLGDLHGFMEFFGMMGKLVKGSGFEDTIYQADMCTSGSVNGVLSGKHYNNAWKIHECFAEAIDRQFRAKYVEVPQSLCIKLKLNEKIESTETNKIINSDEMKDYIEVYEVQKNKCLQGEFGKTPQFWMMYVRAFERMLSLHYAIKTNNFDLRLKIWDEALGGCFSMNKQNYARLGTYFVMQLQNLDQTHPGASEELRRNGMTVCRNNLNIRQSIDGAGESTFMKDAKIAGGIKNFANQNSTYDKWVLSRAGQAEYRSELMNILGMNKDTQEPRKCLRPSEVLKSEASVQKLMQVMESTFSSPFSQEFDSQLLYNIASGCPISDDAADCLLSYETRGNERKEEFKTRINNTHCDGKKLHDPIKKSPWIDFTSNSKISKAKVNGKIQDVKVQRDVLGALVAASHDGKCPVDINVALSYPLSPVSLPLASADGKQRKTNKAKLYDIVDPSCPTASEVHYKEKKKYVLDLAAILRSTVSTPNTFRDLSLQLLNDIPKEFCEIYVACDTYSENSIKSNERSSRGLSERIVVRSPEVRIPPDFQSFLHNGENKERLFEIVEEVWLENKTLLGDRTIFFARAQICTKINRIGAMNVPELASNHEEADTKVVYLLKHAIEQEPDMQSATFVVRSPSGDIDIPIILLAQDFPDTSIIILDSGRGGHRRKLTLNECSLTVPQKKALLSLHAFTGNDQVSSFLRKGKLSCWKTLIRYPSLVDAFCQLGTSFTVSDDLFGSLQEFVCKLYGEKKTKDVDQARRNIFWNSLKKRKSVIDLSLLPPCKRSLRFHVRRANYVSFIWRQSMESVMISDLPQNHGWDENFDFAWTEEIFPQDVSTFLSEFSNRTGDDGDEEYEYGEEFDLEEADVDDDEEAQYL